MREIKTIYPFTYSFLDYPDNESSAAVVFMLGCDNQCSDCQNPNFADKNFEGDNDSNVKKFDIDIFIKEVTQTLKRGNTNKLILTGGDPLYKENIEFVKLFLNKTHQNIDVCIYTGHSLEYIKKNNVKNFKFIKTEKFDVKKKCLSFKNDDEMQFASTNQKLYDNNLKQLSYDGRYSFNK